MRTRQRRRVDGILLAAAGLVVGAVAVGGAAVGDDERITGLWAGAEVGREGSAQITEVIDYDLGVRPRHGIFRDVPGLRPDAPVEVNSATAPDQVELSTLSSSQTRIRIGDPAQTITGRHRYVIAYPLGGVGAGGRLAWDAVGTAWPVRLGNVEVHLVAPFQLQDASCVRGAAGSQQSCRLAQPEPGHLVARIDALDAAEGATLYATVGRRLEVTPRLPAAPSGVPVDATSGLLLPGWLAVVVALVGAAVVSRLVRLAGRERVAEGGAADAAFGGTGREVRVDAERLASLATVEFVPPNGLTAAQGGVVLAEGVRAEHKVAWLISAAIDGYVDLDFVDKGWMSRMTLVRQLRHDSSRDDPTTVSTLDIAFAGRERLSLGAYDASFAAAWKAIGQQLAAWERSSGMWDPAGDRRCGLVRVQGAAGLVVGLAVAFGGGWLANRSGSGWLALVAAGAVVAGAGVAALVGGWELRVRTPAGSGLWLRAASFRRFLAESEAHHAEEAAKRGLLLEYTAWAVAVGEIDHWSKVVAASTVAPDTARYAMIAPLLSSAASASSHAPSGGGSGSSNGGSSGGGSSGGVGGGSGGGGGGSW